MSKFLKKNERKLTPKKVLKVKGKITKAKFIIHHRHHNTNNNFNIIEEISSDQIILDEDQITKEELKSNEQKLKEIFGNKKSY